jgi:lysyl-tRNA synthetase class 2
MRQIIVDHGIFEQFPDFKRGIIVISGISNQNINPEIKELLGKQIIKESACKSLNSPLIKTWESAYEKFHSNSNKFPPSIKSLIKRINKNPDLPYINSVVALFNYISIKYLLPCGGDNIDTIQGNLCLGYAKGNEKFISLGATSEEEPDLNEIIYYDDKTLNVMCRRWNWRNSDLTKITENTKKLVINIDGLNPADESCIIEARDELNELLIQYCQAKTHLGLLNPEHQTTDINI